jgi:uncharacterized protein with HEPN domain
MLLEEKKYLFDIIESINSIEEYIGLDKNFDAYKKDKKLRRAVERELEIIGEAINRLNKLDGRTIEITDSRRIINLRNQVIHGYDSVDDTIIWGIISKYIPLLKTDITNIINNEQ